jgi:mannose-6-phosphate isomerase-like protein (cupin superfamily)
MSRDKWIEPTKGERTGFGKFKKLPLPYDNFMESEGIPVFRDIGIRDIRELPLKPWKRLGGNGTYIQLYGTEGKWGCYVVEVPPAGALNPEKHLYEKIYMVIEGRGSTEVWLEDDESKKHIFEWGPGSIFSIPLNAWHRIVNATNDSALLQAGTTGPVVVNALQNIDSVFNNPYLFKERFSVAEDFYKENNEVEADPVRGLAMRKTNFVADAANCHLPLDNRRSPGWRRIEPHMTNNSFYFWIGSHEGGHYSTAHAHTSAAILFCLSGKGYTYTWPEHLGINPWRDGKEDQVRRMDYIPGGMITAAPGGSRWFHQHFSASSEPLRLTAWFGPHNPGRDPGYPGQPHIDYTAMSIPEGGTSIPYYMEDQHVRKEYEATLEADGIKSEMDPALYETPDEYKDFVFKGI